MRTKRNEPSNGFCSGCNGYIDCKTHRSSIRYICYKIRCNSLYLLILTLLTFWLCIIGSPVLAKVPAFNSKQLQPSIQNPTVQMQDLMQQGRTLYDAGQFAEAILVLQQAIKEYRMQGDELKQAMTLSNLSLAYQQLGRWTEAEGAISDSLNLLTKSSAIQNPLKKGRGKIQNLKVLAQTLNIQGSLQLELGQAEQALTTWKRAEATYVQVGDQSGITQSRINQAQALQVLGFYRRAQTILTELNLKLQSSPDSPTLAVELRSLGDALRLSGDLKQSRELLDQSLKIAQSLQSGTEIGATLLSLGNTARAQQDPKGALAYYQQAAIASTSTTKVQAQINQFSLLVSTGQQSTLQTLLPEIQTQLASLPPSQTTIYARIHLAQSLMKLGTQQSALLLATAVQQARTLEDRRAEAYALGSLGSVYEQNGQWSSALNLTQKALVLAQTINAPDITYRWHWQLGRLLKKQGDIKGAIAAYDAAVSELQPIRSDLVAVNRDVQFSFKESVEPVYRESVELLLQSQKSPSNNNLEKARLRIEALQLAELDDFFREACLSGKFVELDKIVDRDNPTAAIVYPIILPHQLQVIVKIPKLPLRQYWVDKPQKEVEDILKQLQQYILEPDREEEVQSLSRQVYGWLVQPIASELEKSRVNTLVFVLDGALRSLPMAALYDGQQYLVEKYAVALSLGLQLLEPKPVAQAKLKVLAAGLVQPPANYQKTFPPLPEIKSEFKLISQAQVSNTQLLDQDFNSKNLETRVNAAPFNVLHLATHGQFSSRAENTFILAADGPINVTQFDNLLRRRDETHREALEMLVLSACETAAGDNRATLGLAGASVRAGARSTLASLWSIGDQSTAILIGEFYRELASAKVTKAEALRRAQVNLLKKYPNYSRPSYWAPYVLVGNWL